MGKHLRSFFTALLFCACAKAETFYIYQSSEVVTNDPRYPNETKFVTRVFLYRAASSGNSSVYPTRFFYDYSYNSNKLGNPEYFVMNGTTPLLATNDPYSLNQGVYKIKPGSDFNQSGTSMDDASNIKHYNVKIKAGGKCTTGLVGTTFNTTTVQFEIFRVYFDIVGSGAPGYNSLVYRDPSQSGALVELGPGGQTVSPAVTPTTSPADPSWLVWPYSKINDNCGDDEDDEDDDDDDNLDWKKCSSKSSGNQRYWNTVKIGGLVAKLGIPLPLQVLDFKASAKSGAALVTWSTAQEKNTRDFTLQHSADGQNWTDIARLPAAGNSATLKEYSYLHAHPPVAMNFYRLKMNSLSGDFELSTVISLFLSDSKTSLTIFPNPAENILNIHYIAEDASTTTLSITDLQGRELMRSSLQAENQTLDISFFKPGIYQLRLTDSGLTSTRSFVVK